MEFRCLFKELTRFRISRSDKMTHLFQNDVLGADQHVHFQRGADRRVALAGDPYHFVLKQGRPLDAGFQAG